MPQHPRPRMHTLKHSPLQQSPLHLSPAPHQHLTSCPLLPSTAVASEWQERITESITPVPARSNSIKASPTSKDQQPAADPPAPCSAPEEAYPEAPSSIADDASSLADGLPETPMSGSTVFSMQSASSKTSGKLPVHKSELHCLAAA